jgi:ribonucleoside-triphosphate reductase
MSYIEELKALEDLNGESYKDLYDEPLMDYLKAPLDGLTGKDRARQHAMNKTVGRVHQAMEAFIHNMNTIHSRGGNQVVFSSINYGTDTSAEGRCVMREILLSTYEGVGNGETAIFPIQIWKKKRGVNYLPEDRNFDLYQLACKVTARRFFPNFLNLDATFNQDPDWKADDPKRYVHEVATMGCRTRVFENRYGQRTSIGRGNLSFSTINIVKLALECREEQDEQKRIDMFMAKLDQMLEITAKQLDDRFQFQKTAFAKQFPLLMQCLWVGADKLKPMDTIESVINQGTLGIGFIGLAEALVALTGKHHGESEKAQELGVKIVTYMRDRANEFCDRYHHNYSVLATPAEGLSGKFTKKDRKEFGVIPGVTDRDYYTNSNHVPVYYKCSARHKAEVEAPYHNLTRGGHIFYVEIDGDATHNPQVIMSVVDMMDQLDMGYGSVNHNRNRCMDCGYENADDHLEKCPKCGSTNIDKLQRITGYLVGTTDRWNSGKLAELNDRVTHIDHGAQDLFREE